MVLGTRGLGVAWPSQDSWSWEDSGSDLRDSELVWARSSEPMPAGKGGEEGTDVFRMGGDRCVQDGTDSCWKPDEKVQQHHLTLFL